MLALLVGGLSWGTLCLDAAIAPGAGARHHARRHHRLRHRRHHQHRRSRGISAPVAHTSSSHAPCTVFVSVGGDGSSNGSSAGSPTTFSNAVDSVVPGSVVCLLPGTYDVSSNVVLSRSGSASAPIIYRSDGGTALLRYT